jgi:hypothetical protein
MTYPTATSSRRVAGDTYAHSDNEATYGRISTIVGDIANSYRSLTASRLAVFIDTDSIPLGELWQQRIDAGLTSSAVFLPFVSPEYLKSPACRREFRLFHGSLAGRLVIPLIYGDQAKTRSLFRTDPVWREVNKLQFLDIAQLRLEEPGCAVWMKMVDPIARRIDQVLTRTPVR